MKDNIDKFLLGEPLDKKLMLEVLNAIGKFDIEDGPNSYHKQYSIVDGVEHSDQLTYEKMWDRFEGKDGFGGEGLGDTAWMVVYDKPTEQHYKFTYDYRSYDGFDYNYGTWSAVTPKQVTVTQYEAD